MGRVLGGWQFAISENPLRRFNTDEEVVIWNILSVHVSLEKAVYVLCLMQSVHQGLRRACTVFGEIFTCIPTLVTMLFPFTSGEEMRVCLLD